MIRPLSFALLSLLLVGDAFAQLPTERLIVPGQSIGAWSLEITIEELLRVHGRPYQRERADVVQPEIKPDLVLFIWPTSRGRFNAYTVGDSSRVELVEVGCGTASGYMTETGVGCDASKETVERIYGKPTAELTSMAGRMRSVHDGAGIEFVWFKAEILRIGVFRRGAAGRIFKL